MTPITTATIPTANDPALLLIQLAPGKPISYAAIHCDPAQAIDLLRRALIHLVATSCELETVPMPAALVAPVTAPLNGHSAPAERRPRGPKPDSKRRRLGDDPIEDDLARADWD